MEWEKGKRKKEKGGICLHLQDKIITRLCTV